MVKPSLRKALIAVTLSALVAGCGSESGTNLGLGESGGSNFAYNPSPSREYIIRGQVSPSRSPRGVEGIRVVAKEYNPVNPDSKVYTGITDSEGKFEITVDHPGTYVVMADGGRRGRSIRTVEVRGSSSVIDLGQIHLTATGNIEGTLLYDGSPLVGVFVYIPGTSYIAITDKTGHFKISDVPVNESGEGYKLVVKSISSYGYEEEELFGVIGIIQLDPLTPQGIQIVKDLAQVEPHLLSYWAIYNSYFLGSDEGYVFIRNFDSGEEEYSDTAPGFGFVFDKPMDFESLFNAIQIVDSNGQVVQIDDKSELIEIEGGGGWYEVYINTSKLTPGNYTLKVDKSIAKSIYGSNLAEDVEIPFRVGDVIGEVIPGEGIDKPAEIHFSAPVDRESFVNNLVIQDSNGNPPQGLKIYFEPDNMTAYISAVFKENERYTISFDNGTLKTFDNFTFMNLPYENEFSTVKPEAYIAYNNNSNVPKDVDIDVSFNVLMDRDSVERGLQVIDETENKTVDFTLSWYPQWSEEEEGWHYYQPQFCGEDSEGSLCEGEVVNPVNGDGLRLSFEKEYGHTYKIIIDNATTAKGTPLGRVEGEFTVLTPEFLGVDVQNGEIIEPYEGIQLRANVPINDKEGSYDIEFINLDDPTDVVKGVLNEYYVRPEKPLKTDAKYVVKINKLQSEDGWILISEDNPFTVTVQTFRKHIVGTFPHGGQSWVCDGNHHVVIDWNAALTDEEKEALKRFIKVDAYPYYSMGTSSSPTHPDVNVIFGTWGQGQTRMYVDFTWDPDTNYRVYFGDDNGTVLTEIPVEDENGTVIGHLYPDKVIVFTTAPKDEYQKESFIYSTWPADGATVDDIYGQMTITLNTDCGWSNNKPGDFEAVIRECNLNGDNCTELYEGEDYTVDFGYCAGAYIRLNDVDFYKKYEVTVKKLIPTTDYAKTNYIYPDGADESTFYKFSFFTAGPKLWVDVNNVNGYIRFSGNALFNVKELKDALKLQPQINCAWDDNQTVSDDQEYVYELTCYYNPIQYANIGIDIPVELMAYEEEEVFDNSTNSTTIQYNTVGKFENTPVSQVCTVNPDITLPKLESVSVLENKPDGGYAVINLHFNEKLDAASWESANVTVTYQDGNNTVNVPVDLDAPETEVEYCNEAKLCINPDIKVKLDDFIRPGVTYTVKVTGVKEFGGHYEITEEDGTATFSYVGKIVDVNYAGYRYSDNGTNRYKFIFLANADVPLLENQTITYDLYSSVNNSVNIDLNLEIDSDYSKNPDTVSVLIGGDQKNHLALVADYTVSSDYYCSWCYEIEDIYVRDVLNSANETLPDYKVDNWWRYIPSINNYLIGPTSINATEDGIYVTFGGEPQYCVNDPSIYTLLECSANDTTNCTVSSIKIVSVNSTDDGKYLLKTDSVLDNSTTYKLQVKNLLSTGIDFPCEALTPLGIEEVRESDPFQLSNVSRGTQE